MSYTMKGRVELFDYSPLRGQSLALRFEPTQPTDLNSNVSFDVYEIAARLLTSNSCMFRRTSK